MKPLKATETKTMYFWNDDYEIAITFREKDLPPTLNTPTGIKLSTYNI